MCLFVFQLSFVEHKICEIFDCILVNIMHEGFDGLFWDFKVSEFVDGVFVYGSSYSCCYGDEGVNLPFFIFDVGDEWIVFSVLISESLLWESIVAVYEFYELRCNSG